MSDVRTVKVSWGGCLMIVIVCMAAWALVFGVTVSGVHYRVLCTEKRGVEFTNGVAP